MNTFHRFLLLFAFDDYYSSFFFAHFHFPPFFFVAPVSWWMGANRGVMGGGGRLWRKVFPIGACQEKAKPGSRHPQITKKSQLWKKMFWWKTYSDILFDKLTPIRRFWCSAYDTKPWKCQSFGSPHFFHVRAHICIKFWIWDEWNNSLHPPSHHLFENGKTKEGGA